MIPSTFQLIDEQGSYVFRAPPPLVHSGEVHKQGREAVQLLYALNERMTGCRFGPFIELSVFNDSEALEAD